MAAARDDDKHQRIHHDEDAWMAYRWERTAKGSKGKNKVKVDKAAYLPNPDEIKLRGLQVRWLTELGFNNIFIESCMRWDSPRIEVVEKMVAKHGVEETYRRCRPFLVSNERGDPV